MGAGHFYAHRLDRAAEMLLLSLEENPSWAPCYRFLASCYAHLGRLDDARNLVKRLPDITPMVVPSAAHWRIPEQREFFLEGLRLAADETKQPDSIPRTWPLYRRRLTTWSTERIPPI